MFGTTVCVTLYIVTHEYTQEVYVCVYIYIHISALFKNPERKEREERAAAEQVPR